MFRADHFTGNRRGGVCIYYKEHLPIKMLNIRRGVHTRCVRKHVSLAF